MLSNREYAHLLDEIGDRTLVIGDSGFKARAYARAARAIRGQGGSINGLIEAGNVTSIEGIGKAISSKLLEMHDTGTCKKLEELRDALPKGIIELLRVQGLGPKKVRALWEALGIGDLDSLEAAANEGRIAALQGFSKRSQDSVLAEIVRLRAFAGRLPLARALPRARAIRDALAELEGVEHAEVAGSSRRGRPSVGDLDIIVGAKMSAPIMEAFVAMEGVEEVIVRGPTKTSVYLSGGLQADLRVVEPGVFGAALHHFTGSKDHNIEMRSRALQRGLRISEWGVFELDADGEEVARVASATEADVFAAVGLPYIPPEMREGRGEITAAEAGTLPPARALLTQSQIRADLHLHTTASDGTASIAGMAEAAAGAGLEYIAVTDHSQSLVVANGLDRDRLLAQISAIDGYNATSPAVRVLKGLEVDILRDGSLDMDPEVLERLDWVVGSIHSSFGLSQEDMTRRVTTAIRSGLISALGHPTGRKLGVRDGIALDFDAVIGACAEMNVALEVNGGATRLDLPGRLVRRALENPNIWLTINTDAHGTEGYKRLELAVMTARRGWATTARVLNTLSLDQFLAQRRKPERAGTQP